METMNDKVEEVAEDPEDLDEDELDEEDLDEEALDDELLDDDALAEGDDALAEDDDTTAKGDDEDEEDDDVPAARKRPGTSEDDEDEADPDDVEADLDSILKDKMASSDDDEDEEEEEVPDTPAEAGERVAAKGADEFTCNTCFLIVHPRQFGRAGNLSCPEGYDPCPSIKKVEAMFKKAKKA
jgi:hypothetical protein